MDYDLVNIQMAMQDIALTIREANRPRFITLHASVDGKECKINPAHISGYNELMGGTHVFVIPDYDYIVTETPDEIDRLIEEAYR